MYLRARTVYDEIRLLVLEGLELRELALIQDARLVRPLRGQKVEKGLLSGVAGCS